MMTFKGMLYFTFYAHLNKPAVISHVQPDYWGIDAITLNYLGQARVGGEIHYLIDQLYSVGCLWGATLNNCHEKTS